jgi:hypothetical protein
VALSRLVKLAAAAWVARWALREVASYVGHRWRGASPAPIDSRVRPGLMPVPGEEASIE